MKVAPPSSLRTLQLAPVRVDEALRDRETEAGARARRAGAVALERDVEDAGEIVGRERRRRCRAPTT